MTNQSSFASRDYRRLIAAIVLALLIGAGAGYFGSIASGARQSTATSVITSTVTSTTTQFPCSQKPLQESFNSYASRNGTGIAEIDYPVLLLAPGSEGTLCVNPPNPSYSSVVRSYSVFDAANASQISKGISLTESPLNATIPPYGNATVIYTVKASNSSSGAYGIV